MNLKEKNFQAISTKTTAILIVDLLRIPEGTVKSRINRGRIELAKVLRRMKVNPD